MTVVSNSSKPRAGAALAPMAPLAQRQLLRLKGQEDVPAYLQLKGHTPRCLSSDDDQAFSHTSDGAYMHHEHCVMIARKVSYDNADLVMVPLQWCLNERKYDCDLSVCMGRETQIWNLP